MSKAQDQAEAEEGKDNLGIQGSLCACTMLKMLEHIYMK